MAEKVVSVRLQARVEGFTAGMRKAKASVDDLTKADVPKAAKGYKDLADKAALAGVAMAVGLGVAVKRFADFDAAMSAVKANTGGTVDEMESLRKAAIQLGADSQFSATEAAQGINELGKAGIKTADILNGGLKGALDLAAAGQIDVAQAAETTASAMTQFKLKGDQAVHVADLLASGANKAQGGVGDLSAALGQAGLVAAATGLSIEETTGGLAAFASAGLVGSDAGTAFKTMLQRLNAPSAEAAGVMKELGISAYDSQGNFVGLANVAEQLKVGMQDLTPAQRNAANATIFGSDAIRAANVLYEQGADGINKWTDAVDETGAAAKQAATLTDNLKGDLERLGGAFDSVLIQSGSSANSSLRTLVQGLEGMVNIVGKIPGPILLAGTGLAALALAAPKGISAFKNYQATLESVSLSMGKIAERGPKSAKAVSATTAAVKGLGVAFAALSAAAIATNIDGRDALGVESLTKSLLSADDVVAAFNDRIAGIEKPTLAIEGVKDFGDAVRLAFDPGAAEKVDNFGGSIISALGGTNVSAMAQAKDRLSDLDTVLSQLVSSGNTAEAAALFNAFSAEAVRGGASVEQFTAALPGYADDLAGVDNSAKLAAGSTGALAGATDDAKSAAEDAETALKNLKDALDGLGSPVAQDRAAKRGFQSSINDSADALKSYRDSLVAKRLKDKGFGTEKGDKAVTEKATKAAEDYADAQIKSGKALKDTSDEGIALQASLDGINESTKTSVSAAFDAAGGFDNLEAATAAGTEAMKKGRAEFVKAATDAGYTATEANDLADALELIPANVAIAVSQSGAEEAANAINHAAVDRNSTIWVERKFRSTDLASEFQGVGGRATGGAIYGPGSGTSDTAGVFRLSNGEHVWTAAEVAKAGGQSAMYALRAAVRAGRLPGMATGGAVQYAPRTQYVQMAGGGPTSYSETNQTPVFVTGPVHVGTLGDVGTKAEAETWRKAMGRQL